MTDKLIDEIIDFWFDDACRPYWFNSRPTFDRLVEDTLLEQYHKAMTGAFDHWVEDVDGTLALCILLDQVPRNCFRGSPQAFAGDEKARQVAAVALKGGYDLECNEDERIFLYLPFEHHENPDSQELALRLFKERCNRAETVDAAERHHEIIKRFGRFPHRNKALGRESTPEELAFLQEPNSSF